MHVMFDYAPPRSWDQFEELCADIFQSAWRDPALARHGRAGQRQHGVDIVARSGAIAPIGLQCKHKQQWPEKRLTVAEISGEIKKAKAFKPALKAFYVLSTAPDDEKIQTYVRKVNQKHEKVGLFEVIVLGWPEIVRRVTLDRLVADKHFGSASGNATGPPLLATWMVSKGRLEKKGEDFALSVVELKQDLKDWPTGHFVIRQRESDEFLEELRKFDPRVLSLKQRQARVGLREKLAALSGRETRAEWAVRTLLTEPIVSAWTLIIWEEDGILPLTIEAAISRAVLEGHDNSSHIYLRIGAPRDYEQKVRCAIRLDKTEVSDFVNRAKAASHAPIGAMTLLVTDLPPRIRDRAAASIVHFLGYLMSPEHIGDELTWGQIRERGYLDTGNWTSQVV